MKTLFLLTTLFALTGGSFLDCGTPKPTNQSVANTNPWDELPGGSSNAPWICTVWRPLPGAAPCDMVGAEMATEFVTNAPDASSAAQQAAQQKGKKDPHASPPWGCLPFNCSRAPLSGLSPQPPGGCGAGTGGGGGGGGGAPAVPCGGVGDACTSTDQCCAGLLCSLNSCD